MSQKFCLNSNLKGQYHDNINNKSLLLLRAQECSESIKVAPQVPVEHFTFKVKQIPVYIGNKLYKKLTCKTSK